MIKTEIVDGWGSGQTARIDPEGQQHVIVHPHPPKDEQKTSKPYRAYMTRDFDGSTISMLLDGSSTNIEFGVKASATRDLYIGVCSWLISDASSVLNTFGNITALTNGIEFYWETKEEGKVTIHDALKTNFDVIRLSGGNPAFGDGANSFRAPNVSPPPTGAEAYIPFVDLKSIFGLPWGLRLRAGSNDKLAIKLRDNVSGLEQLDIICYGFEF